MPAWITSELRLLMPVPIALSDSSTMTSRPAIASARATASPTTPAPITAQSIFSLMHHWSATRPSPGIVTSSFNQEFAGVKALSPPRFGVAFDSTQTHQGAKGVIGEPAFGALTLVTSAED